jgi:hypothetical protein
MIVVAADVGALKDDVHSIDERPNCVKAGVTAIKAAVIGQCQDFKQFDIRVGELERRAA